jgi:L,D-peptidoglycan transpeptidase YkuD (ErfK/YbiS/YcfS/YnhG family)
MHLSRDDGGPTAGCIGLSRHDLLRLLAAASPDDHLVIR